MYIFILFIIVGLVLLVIPKLFKNNNLPIKKTEENINFAVIIPARDESKVISSLLESIKNQTYQIPMEDVYVIVENKSDPTIKIVNSYGSNIIFRTNLNLKRKGYALDEGIKQIKKEYDAYFIFDADNILDKNYFKEMLKTYQDGYDIGVGYRNSKNGNHNVISACSTLTFSMINTIGNENKNKKHSNILVSGTGFYISGKYIKKWKGYPFNTLTEDYELYLYSIINEMTSYYNTKAIFYDEQPIKYRQTITQRTRWIKGFFSARRKYLKLLRKTMFIKTKNQGSRVSEWIGIKPYLLMVIGVLCLLISLFIKKYYLYFLLLLLLIYLILFIFTYYLISLEKTLNLNTKMKIKAMFYNPIFLSTYIICFIKSFKKNIEWKPIEHSDNLTTN